MEVIPEIVHYAFSALTGLGLVIAFVFTVSWPLGKSRFLLCGSLALQILALIGHYGFTFLIGAGMDPSMFQLISIGLHFLGVMGVICLVAFAIGMRSELMRLYHYDE